VRACVRACARARARACVCVRARAVYFYMRCIFLHDIHSHSTVNDICYICTYLFVKSIVFIYSIYYWYYW